ncbi:MAG: methyl-accepting chemotaxis protein [Clostridiales bacterium]
MKWFLNLSTKVKLYIAFGIILLFTVILFVLISGEIRQLRDNQKKLSSKDFRIAVQSIELRSNFNRQRARELELMLAKDKNTQKDLVNDILERRQLLLSILDTISIAAQGDPFLEKSANDLRRLFDEYKNGRDKEINLIFSGKIEQAVALGNSLQSNIYENVRNIAISMDSYASREVRKHLVETEGLVETTTLAFILFGLGLFIIIFLLVLYMSRIIATPLTQIKEAAEKISEGDVFVEVPQIDRKDEVGILWDAFGKMISSLKNYASFANNVAGNDLRVKTVPKSEKDVLAISLNSMVDYLRKFTSDLSETVSVLSASSTEILTGTAQLAANASETASAIGETTSTVEEVRRTSEMSNSKSKEVLDISQKATEYSEAGKRSTEETIGGINKIGSQMEIIADSIIRLTEQSKAIGEIISSVNELAEQSNLLAVNASIEAARAGEQGKAFGIVAQEIKSLAEQSKQATSQVKAVLNDIQNAINAAVLATEQGEKIVESGIKLASQSEESIFNLAETIGVAKDSAIQTSVISQEQLVGMSQVAMAMENIKMASTQSVTTTRQLESAAKNLQQLSLKLKDTLAIFRL